MKTKKEKEKIRAMAFAGCSFTWGQGLWYYSALDSCQVEMHYGYDANMLNTVHHLFREKWRWPNLVANHFNTVALTHYQNGGANDQILNYWKNCIRQRSETKVPAFDSIRKYDNTKPFRINDISHFVFQFTQWWRSGVALPLEDDMPEIVTVQTVFNTPGNKLWPYFNKWFMKNSKLYNNNEGDFHRSIMMRDLLAIKHFLQDLENNNVKTYVLTWPKEFVEFIKEDEWLQQRFIKFDYNNKNYLCIEDLLKQEKLSIEDDKDFFDIPPKDQHPNLQAQRVIADNVIKFIEQHNG